MKIAVLLYTYNRIDDARINMEIIRNLWSQHPLLKNITIVHSYNGDKTLWPEKYLEDDLLYLDNPGHFAGAEILVNEGVKYISENYHDKDNMWNIGMAIDFAILDTRWTNRYGVFPIRYQEFVDKYFEIFAYKDETLYPERVLAVRFKQAVTRSVTCQANSCLEKLRMNTYIV